MSYDYSAIAATATRLLGRFGRVATLRKKVNSGTEYDPSITYEDSAVKAVFGRYTARDIYGTVIQRDDTKIIIDSAVEPSLNGQIIDGSDTYEIINYVLIKPGDTKLVYIIQGRK